MITTDQVLHYNTFGYAVMRNVFTPDEIETMQKEFETAKAREGEFIPKEDVSTYAHMILLGDDTPFFASLTEDERLYGPAKQIFGEDTVLWEWHGYRYCMFKGTQWHANDGDPTLGRYRYGVRYQWPLFEPVRADTGALRIIPGSHLPEFQWEVRRAQTAGLLDDIGAVGAVVCDADPGDVVVFDTRVFHASTPYHKERNVASGIYAHFPETKEEAAVTAIGFPREQEQWNQWRANKPNSPFRRNWEGLVKRLEELRRHSGYRIERPDPGRSGHLVRA